MAMFMIISPCLCNQPHCVGRCGNIEYIPWPFGIGENCSVDYLFAVTCNYSQSSSSFVPVLKELNLEIQQIRLVNGTSSGELILKIPSVYACGVAEADQGTWIGPNLTETPFSLSSKNVFASVGCDGYAMMMIGNSSVAGCSSVCVPDPPVNRNGCGGFGCCQRKILTPVSSYTIDVRVNGGSKGCRSAFLIGEEYLDAHHQVSFSSPMAATTFPVVVEWSLPFMAPPNKDNKDGLENVLHIAILYVVLPCIGSLLLTYAIFKLCWFCLTKKRRKEIELRAKYFKMRLDEQTSVETIKLFTMKELNIVTNNFTKDGVLGQGGQGIVYKGRLANGQVVAVKKSRTFDESQWKQFINEVILLSQINHRYVVKLFGCCLDKKEPIVIYEFISNGTLFEHIHEPNKKVVLSWKLRVKIASEIATAISYLHTDSPNPIYHRDIKSSNILLDDEYTAKLSDFGISKAVSVDQTHLTTSVQGTLGYLDPEYFQFSQFSEKSDVYSFGAVLIELLTGQTPSHLVAMEDEEEEEEKVSMVEYFMSSMNDIALYKVLDPVVLESNAKDEIVEVTNLARECLNSRGILRPTMKEVSMVLERVRSKNSSPYQPNDRVNVQEIESDIITPMESDIDFSTSSTFMSIDICSPILTR